MNISKIKYNFVALPLAFSLTASVFSPVAAQAASTEEEIYNEVVLNKPSRNIQPIPNSRRYVQPDDKEDFVDVEVDPSRLNNYLAYINDAKTLIDRGLEEVKHKSLAQRAQIYRNIIDRALPASGDKSNELLMRSILRRTRIIHEVILDAPASAEREASLRRTLKEGILWALEVHRVDYSILSDMSKVGSLEDYTRPFEFAILGLDWAKYMMTVSFTAPTVESRFKILSFTAGLLYNDLIADPKNVALLAPFTARIAELVAYLRDLQKLGPLEPRRMLDISREIRGVLATEIRMAEERISDVKTRYRSPSVLDRVLVGESKNPVRYTLRGTVEGQWSFLFQAATTTELRSQCYAWFPNQRGLLKADDVTVTVNSGQTVSRKNDQRWWVTKEEICGQIVGVID